MYVLTIIRLSRDGNFQNTEVANQLTKKESLLSEICVIPCQDSVHYIRTRIDLISALEGTTIQLNSAYCKYFCYIFRIS